MSSAQPTRPPSSRPSRRAVVIAAIVVLAVLAVAGVALLWLFFFGSEAPAAPTLEDAVKVLLPSATP